jgi:protein-tyrosine phosphatase
MPLPCRVDSTVLFICTGNYYRSRFAEALFNHHAELRGLNWRAISRGLAIERVIEINKLSRFTLAAMLQRGIKRQHTSEDLNALTSLDLIETDLAIAMCEAEHRPMMIEKYPLWVDHVIYWRVRDLPDSQPSEAIPEIERQVFLLLDGISASNPIDTRLSQLSHSAPLYGGTDQQRTVVRLTRDGQPSRRGRPPPVKSGCSRPWQPAR